MLLPKGDLGKEKDDDEEGNRSTWRKLPAALCTGVTYRKCLETKVLVLTTVTTSYCCTTGTTDFFQQASPLAGDPRQLTLQSHKNQFNAGKMLTTNNEQKSLMA